MWVNALSGGGSLPKVPTSSFLAHFNGADASTTITDEYGNVCTAQGNAQIDTAQSRFGGASLLLDGTGDYVSVADFAAATPGSSDWLFECWIRPAINNAIKIVMSKRNASSLVNSWFMYVSATGKLTIATWDSGNNVVMSAAGATTVTTNTWHHVGMLKIGTSWGILLDGIVDATATETAESRTIADDPLIGRDASNSARDFNGHIDELRVVKGAEVAGIYPKALTSLVYDVPVSSFEKG